MVGLDAGVVAVWLVEDDEAQAARAQNLFETARVERIMLIERGALAESKGAKRRRVSASERV